MEIESHILAGAGRPTGQEAEELRDIAEVLRITANTDKNIKKSMEALLRIADRLERKKDRVFQ